MHEGCNLQWLVPILDFGYNLYSSKSNCCYQVLVSSCFGSCPDRIMRERDGGEQMCIFIREEIRARVVDGWVNSSTMSWCEPLACPNLLLLTFTFLCRVRKLIFTCDFVAKYYHFAVIRIPWDTKKTSFNFFVILIMKTDNNQIINAAFTSIEWLNPHKKR